MPQEAIRGKNKSEPVHAGHWLEKPNTPEKLSFTWDLSGRAENRGKVKRAPGKSPEKEGKAKNVIPENNLRGGRKKRVQEKVIRVNQLEKRVNVNPKDLLEGGENFEGKLKRATTSCRVRIKASSVALPRKNRIGQKNQNG